MKSSARARFPNSGFILSAIFSSIQYSCAICPGGRYKSGISQCEDCLAGRFSVTENAAFCDACIAGTYQSATGSTSCTSCAYNTFTGASGATSSLFCTFFPTPVCVLLLSRGMPFSKFVYYSLRNSFTYRTSLLENNFSISGPYFKPYRCSNLTTHFDSDSAADHAAYSSTFASSDRATDSATKPMAQHATLERTHPASDIKSQFAPK